jgi:hypothetical protein
MAKCKIQIDKAGMDEFLNSDEIVAVLTEEANVVLGRLGDGYEVQQPAWNGPHRANVAIATTSKRAYWDNIRNNTMLKACRSKK